MIRTIHFPGLTALPLYVAATKRCFDAQGVAVALTAATNSRELMTGVLTGAYEIGQAAIDNLVAYQERQAAPELDDRRAQAGAVVAKPVRRAEAQTGRSIALFRSFLPGAC